MTTEKRLEQLESKLARMKRRPPQAGWLLAGVGLFLGVLIVGWAFGPEPARAQPAKAALKVVRANRFVLVDEKNRPRAMLYMTKDGPALRLYDEKGKTRAALDVGRYGPRLFLQDEKGKLRARLHVDKGGPVLVLHDEKGKVRAELVVIKGGPMLGLNDEKGKTRAMLDVDKNRPGLSLLDEKGNVIWKAP